MKRAVGSYLRSIGSEQSGYILFMVILVLFVVGLVAIMLIVVGTSEVNVASRSRMMEQAYTVAETGINRAVTQVASDYSVANQIKGTQYDDPRSAATLLWGPFKEKMPRDSHGEYEVSIHYDTKNPTVTAGEAWDPFYKLVISTGTYTWGDKSVERTIEAKVYVPAGYQEAYDQAFDYVMYNGFKNVSGESGKWPSAAGDDTNSYVTFPTGKFVFDGASPDEEGNSPLGAIYTRGNIQLKFQPSAESGGRGDRLYVKGRVVATNDLEIQSAAARNVDIDFGDNNYRDSLIAGLDGTGSAIITTGEVGKGSWLRFFGPVCAAGDLTVKGDLPTSAFHLDGGLQAGGNIEISRGAAGRKVWIGDIVSRGSTIVDNRDSGATLIGSITAGSNPQLTRLNANKEGTEFLDSTGLGVGLITSTSGADIKVKGTSPFNAPGEDYSIISRGEVAAIVLEGELQSGGIKAGYGNNSLYPASFGKTADPGLNYGVLLFLSHKSPVMGNIMSNGRVDIEAIGNNHFYYNGGITAGSDAGVAGPTGTGVYWKVQTTGVCQFGCKGEVISAGDIVAESRGKAKIDMYYLKSGGDISLMTNLGTTSDINAQKLEAAGNITMDSSCQVDYAPETVGPGTISAGGDVTINAKHEVHTSMIQANGNVTVSTLKLMKLGGTQTGTAYPGVYSRGTVNLTSWTGMLAYYSVNGIWGNTVNITRRGTTGNGFSIASIPGYGTDAIRAYGKVTLDAAAGRKIRADGASDGNGVIKTGSPPVALGATGTYGWAGYPPNQPGTWSPASLPPAYPAPTVSMPPLPPAPRLRYAGIPDQGQEIDLLREADLKDVVITPKPNWSHFQSQAADDDVTSPNTPHMLVDGGAGDQDHSVNGTVEFHWDSGPSGYSSSETCYQGDPSVTVLVEVQDWESRKDEVNFTGTLVSKGPVKLDAEDARWRAYGQNIMNIISGADFTFDNIGELTNVKTLHFHIYASNNIIFNRGKATGGTKLFGSLTAGNKVVLNTVDDTWENCTFQWSRWNLDAAGWTPTFKVLSWREV